MMKICPRCAGTFAGGSFCPLCGVKQPLIDMSSEEARPFLDHPDMRRAVQSHYVERSGMVRTALGSLVGFLGGLFWLRFAVGADGWGERALWLAVALVWAAFFAGGAVTWARRRARRANDGVPGYMCVDEDALLESAPELGRAPLRTPPRRGFGWLTW